jgi:heme exporter protein B
MPNALQALFMRETTMVLRSPADMASALIFALLVICLFPFALDPNPETLRSFAPGLLMVAVLLAQFVALEKTFRPDLENGTLDVVVQSRTPLAMYALVKACINMLGLCLPLLVISPLLLLLLQGELSNLFTILPALALGSATLALLCVGGSALTLGARQPALLLPLLLVPFSIPVLIFSVGFATHGLGHELGRQSALLLGALFFLYLGITPFIAGAALKSAVENS